MMDAKQSAKSTLLILYRFRVFLKRVHGLCFDGVNVCVLHNGRDLWTGLDVLNSQTRLCDTIGSPLGTLTTMSESIRFLCLKLSSDRTDIIPYRAHAAGDRRRGTMLF